MYVQHCKCLQFERSLSYRLVPNCMMCFFMQVAICPFGKLRVVIVLDHARKNCNKACENVI